MPGIGAELAAAIAVAELHASGAAETRQRSDLFVSAFQVHVLTGQAAMVAGLS